MAQQMPASESPCLFNPDPRIYDEVMGPLYFEAYAMATAGRVGAWNPDSVLETACGTGRVTVHLRNRISKHATLTATDINADMLAFARNKLAGLENIQWREADAMQLPFPDRSFDAVVCQFGAMFFTDKLNGFSEAFRVLKNGGKYILAVWDKLDVNPLGAAVRGDLVDFFEGHPPEGLRTAYSLADPSLCTDLLTQAGFRNVTVETLRMPCETESAEQYAEAFVHGSSVRDALHRYAPDAVPALQEKIRDTVIRKFGDHPVRSTMQAILFSASKETTTE
jgi:ubiquinone/menaquinone biosynthesis C-methylase UbiE